MNGHDAPGIDDLLVTTTADDAGLGMAIAWQPADRERSNEFLGPFSLGHPLSLRCCLFSA
jgi:hypothetical protein